MALCSAKSVWKNPDPVKRFRPAPYSPGPGVANLALSASLIKRTEEPLLTSSPIEWTSPLNAAVVVTPGKRVCRPELTLNGYPLDQSTIVFVVQPPTRCE